MVRNHELQSEVIEESKQNDECLAIEWIADDSSKIDDFILVKSREKRKKGRA
jgi:hypothetical protein